MDTEKYSNKELVYVLKEVLDATGVVKGKGYAGPRALIEEMANRLLRQSGETINIVEGDQHNAKRDMHFTKTVTKTRGPGRRVRTETRTVTDKHGTRNITDNRNYAVQTFKGPEINVDGSYYENGDKYEHRHDKVEGNKYVVHVHEDDFLERGKTVSFKLESE